MFGQSRTAHLTQLVLSSVAGQAAIIELNPPDPQQVQQVGSLILQALVTIVTIWATVRKALQKPEKVVQQVQKV